MRTVLIVATMALAGCTGEPLKTEEGCPIYYGEFMRIETETCIRVYHEELARAQGGTVSRCFNTTGGTTCVTY